MCIERRIDKSERHSSERVSGASELCEWNIKMFSPLGNIDVATDAFYGECLTAVRLEIIARHFLRNYITKKMR